MTAFVSLPAALLLVLSVNHVSSQIPPTAPQCIRTCGTVKVSEGYCSSPTTFATAYEQCLRQNCNPADVTAGLAFTNSVCGAANANPATPAPNSSAPVPAATSNTTLPGAAGNTTLPGAAGNATGANPSIANALRAAGAGSLATLVSSPAAQGYASQLQQSPHTLFAPTDSALAQLPLNSTNPADVNALLEYHTVPGTVQVSQLPPNGHAIVRTALRGAPYVNLPANDSQVLVLSAQPSGVLDIIEPTRNITVANATRADQLEIAAIPNVLTVPGTIGTTAAGIPELSSLVTAINGSTPQLFQELDQTPGLTIFAPINSALANPPPNVNFQSVLLNHIVNGTVLYSTTIANITNATSAGGAHIDFINNSTGTYARSAEKTLLIVQSDIITRNGVIHLVNGIFDPSNSTPTFPLVNQNNATETAGITQIQGASTNSPAAQNAQASTGTQMISFPTGLMAGLTMFFYGVLVL